MVSWESWHPLQLSPDHARVGAGRCVPDAPGRQARPRLDVLPPLLPRPPPPAGHTQPSGCQWYSTTQYIHLQMIKAANNNLPIPSIFTENWSNIEIVSCSALQARDSRYKIIQFDAMFNVQATNFKDFHQHIKLIANNFLIWQCSTINTWNMTETHSV